VVAVFFVVGPKAKSGTILGKIGQILLLSRSVCAAVREILWRHDVHFRCRFGCSAAWLRVILATASLLLNGRQGYPEVVHQRYVRGAKVFCRYHRYTRPLCNGGNVFANVREIRNVPLPIGCHGPFFALVNKKVAKHLQFILLFLRKIDIMLEFCSN